MQPAMHPTSSDDNALTATAPLATTAPVTADGRAAGSVVGPPAEVLPLTRQQRRRIKRLRLKPDVRCEYGWQLGTSVLPAGQQVWVTREKHSLVVGPSGCGKTIGILAPALLAHRGPALNTVVKLPDLYLTLTARQRPLHEGGPARPVAVLDPYGLAPGVPAFVWDPIQGCTSMVTAERRAAAFAAGTVAGGSKTVGDDGARFYRDQATKVLKCYFLAAAITGSTMDHVVAWAASARNSQQVEDILRRHPQGSSEWADVLHSSLTGGDPRTSGNTIVTVHSALNLFFQPEMRARCIPGPGRPATDIAQLIQDNGTFYLLGREDVLLSASPLMTAVAEHILDTAAALAPENRHGKLLPWFLAVLDELPNIAPIPSIGVRLGTDRDYGICYILGCQAWQQLVVQYGPAEAAEIWRATTVKALFGGGSELDLYREICALYGEVDIERTSRTRSRQGTTHSTSIDRVPILTEALISSVPANHVLVDNRHTGGPVIARLHRCIDGRRGRAVLADQATTRDLVNATRAAQPSTAHLTVQAIAWSQAHGYGALIAAPIPAAVPPAPTELGQPAFAGDRAAVSPTVADQTTTAAQPRTDPRVDLSSAPHTEPPSERQADGGPQGGWQL